MSSMTKSQKEKGLIALAVLFLLTLGFYSYFLLYAPAQDAREQAQQSLRSERDVLMALQTQVKELPEGETVSTLELQKKVSIDPLSELMVLQIEEAELVSGTQIEAIQLAEADVELPIPVEGLENLKEVEATVAFSAENYGEITDFISEIEEMERILVIEAINFGANPEVREVVEETERLQVTLSFAAYYRPDLIALEDTVPKIDAPSPADKQDPLPANDGTEYADDDEEEIDSDVDVDVEVTVEESASGEE
ncbi:pilus assembly protein PilO [Planococcus maritimus]|uniref:type II secretion system protein M n=2 Tax=Planococcus maritimus TaxID=192421 RepID=UPI0007919665|nr:type II secretion system protein M [Planococcus maritimus]KYG58082.1 pilus assembly protein PilO [Planococcus maritimus]OED32170.1 pilus assembly protein PilO [Planococcus maritimus]